MASRRDRPVSFDFAQGKLPAGAPAENLSVRWSGSLITMLAGDYQLVVKGRGGDGKGVADVVLAEEGSLEFEI